MLRISLSVGRKIIVVVILLVEFADLIAEVNCSILSIVYAILP